MRPPLSRAWLVCVALMPAASNAAADTTPPVHHEIELRLEPAEGTLTVRDRVRFPRPLQAGTELVFTLNAGLRPTIDTPRARLVVKGAGAGPAAYEHYAVVPEVDGAELTLRYRGRLAQRCDHADETRGHRQDFSTGYIGPEGVFLTDASHWYPRFGDELVTFSLDVQLPAGWEAVSQGESGPRDSHTGDGVVRWRERQPQQDIVVAANRFRVYARATPVADALIFLRQPDEVLAGRYLDATARYLDLYERLIGPYPYAKFALVENFWETGYGMPSFTLLGSRVLRLPFIIDSSYPHEILHSWWGNAVYVDYDRGNWSEGLTAYLADHLVQEDRGRGAEYRRSALEKYRNYVSHEKDFALNRFRAKHGEASAAVGYNKTLMFFHMLRRQLGDRVFIEALRDFYTERRFQRTSYAYLQASFERVSGLDLSFEFDQWVNRIGAPHLRVHGLVVEPAQSGYRLRGRLEQTQNGPAYRLLVPVAVELEGYPTALWHELALTEKTLEFDLAVPARPLHFAVDPEFDLFRRLELGESPPALGELFGADDVLFVLPAGAPEPLRESYRDLAERMGAKTLTRDDGRAALPADRPVWLLGWENAHREVVAQTLATQEVSYVDDGVRIGEGIRFRDDECVVLVGRRPNAEQSAIGWIGCDNRRAFAGLSRKLPHYGKYGLLSFIGDAPTNVLKDRWQTTESPLVVGLTPRTRQRPLSLESRPALTAVLDSP